VASFAVIVALVGAVALLFKPVARALIRARLGGYVRRVPRLQARRPSCLDAPRSVAVVGGGIAGLTAALVLARRGYAVSVFESKPYLGGKLASWSVATDGDRSVPMSHGFHAFFRHYHNLHRLLRSLKVKPSLASIGDYVILGRDGAAHRFAAVDRTPLLNLFSLVRQGILPLRDALRSPGRDLYGLLLEYTERDTFARYDGLSYADFCRVSDMPPKLRLVFHTFARSFFAEPERLSFAELVKSFHFYFLSQDAGLIYDYPTVDYEKSVIGPIRAEIEERGGVLTVSSRVERIGRRPGARLFVNDTPFDRVVLAGHAVAMRELVLGSEGLPEPFVGSMRALTRGQRYAVLRLFVLEEVSWSHPPFVSLERDRLLDAIALMHRIEEGPATWARANGGAVVELHSYAIPDSMPNEDVEVTLVAEATRFLPRLKDATVAHRVCQMADDFTAFHVGQYGTRPTIETGDPHLVCAGDWVKLPFPAMLLEGACSSGVLAANAILRVDELEEEEVSSVPLTGLMAGLPPPPGRAALLARATKP
jgi:isorenieratene synthase